VSTLSGFEPLVRRRTLQVLEVTFRNGFWRKGPRVTSALRKALNGGVGSGGRKITNSAYEDC
jgi:hypothetical protein